MVTIEFRAKIKNGMIEIPAKYKGKVKNDVKVILIAQSEKKAGSDIVDELMTNPLKVKSFKPMTRDETHARE